MGATFFYFSHLLRNKIGVPGITGRPDNETPCPPQSEAASPVFPGPSLAAPGRTSCPPHTQSGLTDDDGGAPRPRPTPGRASPTMTACLCPGHWGTLPACPASRMSCPLSHRRKQWLGSGSHRSVREAPTGTARPGAAPGSERPQGGRTPPRRTPPHRLGGSAVC